ncbi:hypothetical protein B0H67DRAFT_256751 [Lasiosphaeris hirsuta]|uniref:Nephrocystin 3-like N-terminal domain-containing protein n=1 Tax=Lasiosphaeris hirsuta TaxID=260670 RepID=A0AA40DWE4_9PEZI|nr:hypothetical protein B0H67DRAFT_256751 [Lasiosphaeris hirsuta]
MASETIGFIGFAIDVCERLVTYYKKWAAYHEDISDMIAKLDSFIELQKQFQHGFAIGRFQLELLNESSRVMVKLTKSTSDLEKKLDEIGDSSILPGLSGKISSKMRRLLYPFRKSTILRIEEIIEDSAEDVHDLMIKTCQIYGADNNRALNQLIDSWEAANLRSEFKDIFSAMAVGVEILQPKQSQYRTRRLQSTCKWATESDTYKQWKQGNSRSLFLSGVEGCGKSMLCAAIVDDLETTTLPSEAVVAAHFFDATSRRTTSLMSALASITFQLCCGLGDDAAAAILAEIRNKRSQTYQQYEATTEDLRHAFKITMMQAAGCNRRVYIVVDGLNEADEIEAVRGWLETELFKTDGIAMWLLSDRKDPRLEQGNLLKLFTAPLELGRTEISSDLWLYIQDHIRVLSRNIGKEKKQELLDHLMQKSEGLSFRYVDCFFNVLKNRRVDSNAELGDAMKTLPDGIFALYDCIMDDIKTLCPDKARNLLEWLLVAQRPLRLEEIRDAIAVERSGDAILFNPERRPSKDGILDICPHLVAAYSKDFWDAKTRQVVTSGTLQLSSNIVREYLLSLHFQSLYSDVFRFSVEICQRHVAECCALFLQEQARFSVESPDTLRGFISDWKSGIDPDPAEHVDGNMTLTYQAKAKLGFVRRDVFDDFPILSYVAPYWPVHVGECIRLEGFPLTLTRVMHVLVSEEMLSRAWGLYYHEVPFCSVVDVRRPESGSETYQRYKDACVRYVSAYSTIIGKVPPLYAAIYFGWEVAVRWMLDNHFMYDGSSYDPVISSPLQLAVLRRFSNIVQDLVDAGCKGNEKGKPGLNGRTPMQAAVAAGDVDIIRILAEPLQASPEELYKAWSGPGAYLARQNGGQSTMDAVLSTLAPPFDARWVRQVLQERLWFAGKEDSTMDYLIDKARQLTEDSTSIVTPRGIAFAAKNAALFERLLPYAEIDTKSFNIVIQETAVQLGRMMAPRDQLMADIVLKLLLRSEVPLNIQPETLGVLAIHGYRKALSVLLKVGLGATPELTVELAAFDNTIQTTALLHPGLIDIYDDQYPTMTELLFSATSRVPLRGELACYLADWLVLRRTLAPAGVKPPILVLDPPAAIMWQSAPNWKEMSDTDEPRPWGLGLVAHGPDDGNMEVGGLKISKIDDLEAPLWKFVRENMETHGEGDLNIAPLFEERSWWPAGSGRLSDVWLCKLDDGGLIELRIWQHARVAKRNRDGMRLCGGVKEGVISTPDFSSWKQGEVEG